MISAVLDPSTILNQDIFDQDFNLWNNFDMMVIGGPWLVFIRPFSLYAYTDFLRAWMERVPNQNLYSRVTKEAKRKYKLADDEFRSGLTEAKLMNIFIVDPGQYCMVKYVNDTVQSVPWKNCRSQRKPYEPLNELSKLDSKGSYCYQRVVL